MPSAARDLQLWYKLAEADPWVGLTGADSMRFANSGIGWVPIGSFNCAACKSACNYTH
jgi:hypothetical protein